MSDQQGFTLLTGDTPGTPYRLKAPFNSTGFKTRILIGAVLTSWHAQIAPYLGTGLSPFDMRTDIHLLGVRYKEIDGQYVQASYTFQNSKGSLPIHYNGTDDTYFPVS
jgi:hypothetical protein